MRFHADLADVKEASALRRRVVDTVVARVAERVDPQALEFIVGELVANAAEHAPGPVTVRIDWRARPPRLTLEDSGDGFTLAARGAVLPDAGDDGGRGIYIINKLGGRLSVDCSKRRRCRVSVDLPVVENTRSVCREILPELPRRSAASRDTA